MAGCSVPVVSTSYQELGGVAEQLARLDLGAARDGDVSASGGGEGEGEGVDVNDDGGIVEESRPYSSGPQTDPRLERQRQSPCSTRSSRAFFDVPFPLHPEKTFRIHTTPLIGSPLATSVTTGPVPSLATPFTVTVGIGETGSVSSLSASISRSRIGGSCATNSANVQPRPSLCLRSTPGAYSPFNEDKYTSPSQSPSRSMSRVRWSREDNYSTICSPSSSPLWGGKEVV
ncbi:hypothetical protein P691DRAFT_804003 [Macrolepiota fuliginosa MF-IS2]|uniref:Uncharacterized protein n=1 Tax=Macrolepiota fuliginosa MF-IS2 TaxID=1400762 RepID=A0A9P6BZK5_9AGAR|nr:hypothetical protein P691DRAFT_804003 [Macrolepiota fuliginosa MF-IS2]